jgi:hypothetical protein
MNRSVYVLGLAILTMGTPLARSSAVYSMGDPGTGTPVTSSFFFFSDAAGGGVLSFMNESGLLWQNVLITVTELDNTAITILPGPFFNTNEFSSKSNNDGTSVYSIGLFNTGQGLGGIANNEFFTINLNDLNGNTQNSDPNGAGGWGANIKFGADANAVPGAPGTPIVPEPASTFLVITGLGLTGWGSRRLHRNWG